jgi:hypothetical protein
MRLPKDESGQWRCFSPIEVFRNFCGPANSARYYRPGTANIRVHTEIVTDVPSANRKKAPFAIRADRRTGPMMSDTSVRNSNLAHENVIWNEAVVVDRRE